MQQVSSAPSRNPTRESQDLYNHRHSTCLLTLNPYIEEMEILTSSNLKLDVFWDKSSLISWNYEVTWILDFTPSPLTSSGDTVSDWKFGVVMSLLRQFATLGTLWCTFGWLETERRGSFERRVLNKNTWQGRLGSWFFQSDGRNIRLTSLPAESLFDYSMYIMQHLQVWINKGRYVTNSNLHTMQISRKFKSSSIAQKVKSWHTKFPWRGAWIYNPKISASCMEIHMKPIHESLHHRNQEGKTEATMIPVTSSGARNIG